MRFIFMCVLCALEKVKPSKLESIKPSSQSKVRLRTNTYTHTCTYTTHILSFLETRSIEMKPVFKPIKWYTHTHTPVLAHTHVLCQRIQRHIHGKKFGAAAAFVVVALPHHGFNAAAAPLLKQQ